MPRLPNPWPFRRASTPVPAEESRSSRKQVKAVLHPNTNVPTSGLTNHRSEHGAGHTTTPSMMQSRYVNVVLVAEAGVGKSSNLIAQREVAQVSSDVNGCTMQSTRYDISFDGTDYAIFETIGLGQPKIAVNDYLKAIAKAYELILELNAAGGIHLLLFCMRGGRVKTTTLNNYRLFYEGLCATKVPMALVFSGLEWEAELEDWWKRNETYLENYGIRGNGHACVTAVRDHPSKFRESQQKIRELLKDCALKDGAFLPESYSWSARLGRELKSFADEQTNPMKRDIVQVLAQRCKLSYETAGKIADMMERGNAETM